MSPADEPDLAATLVIHVRAAGRPGSESDRLLDELGADAWPGGPADRTDPVAQAWLQVSGPSGWRAPVPTCTCVTGDCRICN